MSNGISFDEILKKAAAIGSEEKKTIEVAQELANVIDSIVSARISAGLTQRQLAKICGVKQSAIARMESLQAIPRLDTLIKVAKSLGVSIKIESEITKCVSDSNVVYLCDFAANRDQYSWGLSNWINRKVEANGTLG